MRGRQIACAALALLAVIAGAAAAGAAYPRPLPASDSREAPVAIALAPSCSRATIITCTLSAWPMELLPDLERRR